MRKKILIGIGLLVLLGVCASGIYFFVQLRSGGDATNALPTAQVQRGTLAVNVRASGMLDARARALLRFGAQGTVKNVFVQVGDRVQCGQVLGVVGNTPKGWSSDPHLHFETRIGPPGVTFQGMDYYDTGATAEEMANYRRWRMTGEFAMFDPMRLLEYGLKGDTR